MSLALGGSRQILDGSVQRAVSVCAVSRERKSVRGEDLEFKIKNSKCKIRNPKSGAGGPTVAQGYGGQVGRGRMRVRRERAEHADEWMDCWRAVSEG